MKNHESLEVKKSKSCRGYIKSDNGLLTVVWDTPIVARQESLKETEYLRDINWKIY